MGGIDAAQSGGGDIYLVRPGEDARRLEVAGSDTADEACPAWSPDGTRLLFGRVTGSSDTTFSDAELVIVPVGLDGAAGAPTVIALDGFDVLQGFDPHPCAVWAPDGRWVAFGGAGEVWVVDTQTGAIRRLPDLRPSDLEWRPGTDQLAIAGDMGTNRAAPTLSTPVTVYSVSTGELHQLGSVEAAHLTWSPDGSTLAYQGGEDDPDELWLVDADGANERLLVADSARRTTASVPCGPRPVTASPTNALRSPGSRMPRAARGRPRERCRWEPDGHRATADRRAERAGAVVPLQRHVVAGRHDAALHGVEPSPGRAELPNGVIAVPADTPSDVTVLTDAIDPVAGSTHRWVPIQMWGRQPG